MCGIVGAVAQRDVSGILLEGLKRLEYRGYDSAGMALVEETTQALDCIKALGKVEKLEESMDKREFAGKLPDIEHLVISPDLLGPSLQRLAEAASSGAFKAQA